MCFFWDLPRVAQRSDSGGEVEAGAGVIELAQAAAEAANFSREPAGQLRLVATTQAYLTVLRPVLGAFLEHYPGIDLDIVLSESRVDLVRDAFDAGLGLGSQVELDLVAIGLGPARCMLALAAPDYLARRGTPRHPRELSEHDCIGYRRPDSCVIERWVSATATKTFNRTLRVG